jgi:hypothetical protein
MSSSAGLDAIQKCRAQEIGLSDFLGFDARERSCGESERRNFTRVGTVDGASRNRVGTVDGASRNRVGSIYRVGAVDRLGDINWRVSRIGSIDARSGVVAVVAGLTPAAVGEDRRSNEVLDAVVTSSAASVSSSAASASSASDAGRSR